jgi:hypothetical protein
LPRVPVAWATPIEPLQHNPSGFVAALWQAGGVAMDSVGMGVPTELGVAPREPYGQPAGAGLLTPRGAARERGPEVLPCGPAFAGIVPLAILAPPQREPPTLEARLAGLLGPTAREEPCLGARQLQAAFLQPLPPHAVEAFRVCVVCERAHTIVGGAPQTRVALPGPFDHLCTPHIEPVGQAHLGEYGGHRPAWRGPGHRGQSLTIWVEPPGFQPLPAQAQQCASLKPLRDPPPYPVMLDGSKALRDGRFPPQP